MVVGHEWEEGTVRIKENCGDTADDADSELEEEHYHLA